MNTLVSNYGWLVQTSERYYTIALILYLGLLHTFYIFFHTNSSMLALILVFMVYSIALVFLHPAEFLLRLVSLKVLQEHSKSPLLKSIQDSAAYISYVHQVVAFGGFIIFGLSLSVVVLGPPMRVHYPLLILTLLHIHVWLMIVIHDRAQLNRLRKSLEVRPVDWERRRTDGGPLGTVHLSG